MDSLEKLLEAEFNLPVSWDEPKGNESFVLDPQGDVLLELLNNAQTRNYIILISYIMNKPGFFENVKSHLTKRAERVKRLIMNNTNYSPSGTYRWQEAKITETVFSVDEENPEIKKADMTFECISTEVI